MVTQDHIKVIADTYGYETQRVKLIEELSELIQALCKNDYDKIEEEMGDVEIMLEQVKYLGGFTTENIKEYKLVRQIRRIGRG